jgi:hypothetical protein
MLVNWLSNPSEAKFIHSEIWSVWTEPYAGVDYKLILSHSRLRSPALHPNDDDCRRMFPQLFEMEQPIGKGRVQGRGEKGWGADFMSENRYFMEHGKSMTKLT